MRVNILEAILVCMLLASVMLYGSYLFAHQPTYDLPCGKGLVAIKPWVGQPYCGVHFGIKPSV